MVLAEPPVRVGKLVPVVLAERLASLAPVEKLAQLG